MFHVWIILDSCWGDTQGKRIKRCENFSLLTSSGELSTDGGSYS